MSLSEWKKDINILRDTVLGVPANQLTDSSNIQYIQNRIYSNWNIHLNSEQKNHPGLATSYKTGLKNDIDIFYNSASSQSNMQYVLYKLSNLAVTKNVTRINDSIPQDLDCDVTHMCSDLSKRDGKHRMGPTAVIIHLRCSRRAVHVSLQK